MERMKKTKTIGVVDFTNPDYCSASLNIIRMLENDHSVVVCSRNERRLIESFSPDTRYFRFGRNLSRSRKNNLNAFLKVTAFFLFTIKTLCILFRYRCKILVVFSSYGIVTALIAKILNPKIKIFYQGHEVVSIDPKLLFTLGYFVDNILIKYVRYCDWVGQPDIKRVEYFKQLTGIKKVNLFRNFAPRYTRTNSQKDQLCENLKRQGYTIIVHIGTIGEDCYLDEVVDFVKTTNKRIAMVFAGKVGNERLKNLLENPELGDSKAKLIYRGFFLKDQMYKILNSADIALVLYKEGTLMAEMNAGASVKAGEYIASGLPIIYPYFWNYESFYKDIGLSYDSIDQMLAAVETLTEDTALRKTFSQNSRKLFDNKLYFEKEAEIFKRRIDHCLN